MVQNPYQRNDDKSEQENQENGSPIADIMISQAHAAMRTGIDDIQMFFKKLSFTANRAAAFKGKTKISPKAHTPLPHQ